MPNEEDDIIELRCPDCGAVIRIPEKEAEEKNVAKCPKGHVVPIAKAL